MTDDAPDGLRVIDRRASYGAVNEAPAPHDPRWGIPPPRIVVPEERSPLDPPASWCGSVVRCGGCGDWLRDGKSCPLCTPPIATPNGGINDVKLTSGRSFRRCGGCDLDLADDAKRCPAPQCQDHEARIPDGFIVDGEYIATTTTTTNKENK